MSGLSKSRGFGAIAWLVALAVTIAAVLFYAKPWQSETTSAGDGPFEIADFSNRDFEGSPALALSFTHPMDAKKGYDEQIQVFEMPPRPGVIPPEISGS